MKLSNSIFCLFLVSAGAAWADQLPESAVFEEVDKDGDKSISMTEANSRLDLKENFARIDKNADGKLDISEFSAFEAEGKFQPPEAEKAELGAAPLKR